MKRTKLKMMFALLVYVCLLMSCASSSEIVASKAVFMRTNDRLSEAESNRIARYVKRHTYVKDKVKTPDRYYFHVKGIDSSVFCAKNPEDNCFYLGVDSCKYILPISVYSRGPKFKVVPYSDSLNTLIKYNKPKLSRIAYIAIDANKTIVAIIASDFRCSLYNLSKVDIFCGSSNKFIYYIDDSGKVAKEQL